MSLYTKRGDGGQTDLLGGERVSKADIRIECCGAVDELNAVLGLAKSLCQQSEVKDAIEAIQQDLFLLGAELAGGDRGITAGHVAALQSIIDRAETGEWTGFTTPGADPGSAALHVARTVCRRAERDMVRRVEAGYPLSPQIMSYVNRLSDALFALARMEEQSKD